MGEEILFCPKCGNGMIKKNQDYWQCPKCMGEWWPDENRLAYLEEEHRAMAHAIAMRQDIHWRLCSASYKPALPTGPVPGWTKGGSRSSGRKRKKPVSAIREVLLFN